MPQCPQVLCQSLKGFAIAHLDSVSRHEFAHVGGQHLTTSSVVAFVSLLNQYHCQQQRAMQSANIAQSMMTVVR